MNRHSRRDFLRLTGLTTAGGILAACGPAPATIAEPTSTESQTDTTPVAAAPTAAPIPTVSPTSAPEPVSKYNESPMLAKLVAAGTLPPVDERLPEEPRVCEVIDSIGEYGGTLTVGDLTTNLFGGDAGQAMDRPNWLRISRDTTHAVPHILRDWDMTDDFTQVTCYMRKGMKWSDGAPLTSADVKFWYEDILLNEEITPLPHMGFRPGGEIMGLEVVDDYTYRVTFAQPHPSFIMVFMAHLYGFWDHQTFVPAHYVKQFHLKYNDKANDLAKAAGFDFWYQHLGRENNRAQSIDRPRLEAFMPVRDTAQMSFLERNPYYHAVDPEGNQLPYIDKIQMDRAADLAVLDAKFVGGSYDFAAFQMRILNYATYAEGAEASDSRIILWQSGKGSEVLYNVNMNWPDEEWRTVFQDDRFRHALSLAINRPDINEVIYFGNASETQYTVIPASRHYNAEYSKAYAEYDPERANALLDEIGLEWNADRTHRLWPVSKKPIVIPFDAYESETPKGPITELVTEYWNEVGIEIQWKSITRNLLTQKVLANEEPMSLWHGDLAADPLFLRDTGHFVPRNGDNGCWGVLWGRWHDTKGESGEEPPEVIKDLYKWMEEYNLTNSDEPAANVLASQAEHVWSIGTVGNAPHPLMLRNSLRNVSETTGYWTWDTLWSFPEFPEQWYFES